MSTQETTIKLSKGKIILLTLGSMAFVVTGIWMWSFTDMDMDALLYKVVALAAILFFGMTGIYGLTKIFDNKPGLIINEHGLLDNSSAVSGNLIKWSDIEGFDLLQVSTTKFLLIFVKNPQDYLDKANWVSRFWMKMNNKYYGTPLSISSSSLQCNFEELLAEVNAKVGQYGSA